MEALGHLDPPDADFAGPVIIGVIGRLDVAIVLFHISPADGFADTVLGGGKGRSVRMFCLAQESFSPSSSPSHIPQLPSALLPIPANPMGSLLVPHISDPHPPPHPIFILSTFIDGKEALPDPVATASEFNPEAAVGGDDRLREFAPAEAACGDGVGRGAVRPDLSPPLLLTPACPSEAPLL